MRIRRTTPELTPAERGIFRDFRASELEARREQFSDFGQTSEVEFQQRIDQAERRLTPTETEFETEAQTRAEREALRTQLNLTVAEDQGQDPFEIEDFETELTTPQELVPIETELPPRETEGPPIETEPPREPVEPVELPDFGDELDDDLLQIEELEREGVRAVEAVLDPGELDIE